MALPSLAAKESGSRRLTYCRKQKSLGLLCSNFLSLYDRDGVETVGLDDAASRLGVERRRIYDIVNVLESVGVLKKKGKNSYYWNGFEAIPRALQVLKAEGTREYSDASGSNLERVSDDDEEDRFSDPSNSSQKDKLDQENRREKSLGILTRSFVKLFICTGVDMISLDEAANTLLGNAQDSSMSRTKVRRLYDIANVLASINFIEKIHHPETRKPAFRWLGTREKSEPGSAIVSGPKDATKRTFGSDLTNMCPKRNKLSSLTYVDTNLFMKTQSRAQVKCEPLELRIEKSCSEQGSGHEAENYLLGPFAPAPKPLERLHGSETLAFTHHPQYHNQALKDLFIHYMEAWKSWYSEITGNDPVRAAS